MTLRYICILSIFLSLLISACQKSNEPKPVIIPVPQEVFMSTGLLNLSDGFTTKIKNPALKPLRKIIQDDYYLLCKKELSDNSITLTLEIDSTLIKGQYILKVDDNIMIKGGSYNAIALALSSIWQAMSNDFSLPKMVIKDHPNYNYRSIMLDVARAWHSPETIKEIIDLCRWYKINYLHLHLTDDSAFSFPSEAFPLLATDGHSYTKAQLLELNQYAYDRGVILVPELDVPGHSSQFIKKMPALFGIAEITKNPYTVSMAREDTYAALERLIDELATIFTYSPFIHIGGDEAFFEGMEDDPATIAYMAKHGLPNLHELFRHFLIRLNKSVKKAGKQTIVWAGFGEEGDLKIPTDVIVMLWEHSYHDPHDLLEKEYPIINASFKPLYVVNNRKWSAKYIYDQWLPNRWESWTNEGDFIGVELQENRQVMGATMCAWEQNQINQMSRLRTRVASMAQHLWSATTLSWSDFNVQQQQIDIKLNQFTSPFAVQINGLMYPELGEGNFYEHRWFEKELVIKARSDFPELQLQYAKGQNPAKEDWQQFPSAFTSKESFQIHIRSVNKNDVQIGREYFQKFYHKPLKASTKGLWKELPIGSWEKLRFEDTLWISLSTELAGNTIRYQTNGQGVNTESMIYKNPIPIVETTLLQAQLFNKKGHSIGSPFREQYYKIWKEKSLTTNKPISASNDHILPNCAAPANNGRITLWEMWGDHVAEENWVKIDLEKTEVLTRFKVYTFWDDWRYYQYTIEVSPDNKNWVEIVDFSNNEKVATNKGIEHKITPTPTRYVRINMLYNSANPGLHLVEIGAFAD